MATKTSSWNSDPARASKDAEHLAAMEAADVEMVGKPIVLPQLDLRTITVRIVGESPLICHKWSEKAKRQMLHKQMGKASPGKEPKDPVQDFQSSLYMMDDGSYGFPTIAFKCSAVSACTSLGKTIVTKVAARQAFHILGEYAKIEGTPTMREDMVRLSGPGNSADIRYRGEFKEWSTVLTIKYNARLITDEQICNLLNTAGFAVGVGEWRPEKDGQYGRFRVG